MIFDSLLSLDQAFLRRLRFVVEFPFPTEEQREAIWKKALEGGVPLAEIDYSKLARLSIAGGTIRNIAIGAAFRAAKDWPEARLSMEHLKEAARLEFLKAQHILTQSDVGDWV